MFVTVAPSPLHGRGCFTTRAVEAGEVVARSTILILPPEETRLLMRTRLKNYVFFVAEEPGSADDAFESALVMGPISFCNHSAEPNCDFAINAAASEIVLTARRPLVENEEITISYGDYAEAIV